MHFYPPVQSSPSVSQSAVAANPPHSRKPAAIGMLVAAAGVVYGDIGTSPLYTLKEVFAGHYGVRPTPLVS